MKKIIAIILVGILSISGFGAVAISGDRSIEVEGILQCSEPKILENEHYLSISLQEADTYLNNPGQPVLPVITKTYTFPIGTIISEVNCQPVDIQEKSIDKEITYASKPVPRLSGIELSLKTIKDESVYKSSSFYPDSWYDYNIGVGLDGKEHVTYLTIQFYPVRYSPKNNVINYASNAYITIKYEPPKSTTTFTDDYDLVIISPWLFSSKLQRLVDHKENMGVKTKLITTQEIYRTYDGRDHAEKIKYCIKHAFEEWGISYVLLFGGMRGQSIISWYVPIRYSLLDDASGFEDRQISDLYFADIYKYDDVTGYVFDDWDSNGDGVFGEWSSENKDVLDMYPDVYVGRLPCRYRSEVDEIVDRIIDYETTTKGQEWFNKMAVIGGDSFDDISWNTSTDFIEGQVETEHALSYMDGFEHIRIWVEGGDIEYTTENAESVLNQGQGFVYFSGHGNPSSWSTHPHANFSKWISFGLGSIKKMTNGNKLPVLIVGGCHNCQFDVSILKMFNTRALMWGEATPKCWGWQFASLPGGGSIASIGNTGLGYGTIGDGPSPPDEIPDGVPDGIPDCIQYLGGWIESHFFDVYKNHGKDILGETHGQTLADYLNQFPINWEMNWVDHDQSATLVDCKTVQQWILFGDPSLKIGGY